MKYLILITALLFISCKGFCDTIDYWHVYYNNTVIAKLNQVSRNLTVKVDLSKVKKEDKISIRHGDDTPCHKCKFLLLIRDERRRKIGLVKTTEFWGKLTVPLSALIEFGKKNQSKYFNFYYFEQDTDNKFSPKQFVLQVILK